MPHIPKLCISRSVLAAPPGRPHVEPEEDGFARKLMKLKLQGPSLAGPRNGLATCCPVIFLQTLLYSYFILFFFKGAPKLYKLQGS